MKRQSGKAFAERMWRSRVLRQVDKLEAVMSERPRGATLGKRETSALEGLMRESAIGVRFQLPKPKPPVRMRITDDIPAMARKYGVETAVDIAKALNVHPDLWAVEVADDFPDYSVHELYDAALGDTPPGSASAAG